MHLLAQEREEPLLDKLTEEAAKVGGMRSVSRQDLLSPLHELEGGWQQNGRREREWLYEATVSGAQVFVFACARLQDERQRRVLTHKTRHVSIERLVDDLGRLAHSRTGPAGVIQAEEHIPLALKARHAQDRLQRRYMLRHDGAVRVFHEVVE